MIEWKPEKNISSPWDVDVWENNIGQPVKPSGDNLPYPYTTPPLKIGQSGYKLNPEKLAKASQSIFPYLFSCFYFTEEFEYFDLVKPYLDLPEPRKSIDEIKQEFDEKMDELIAITKGKFEYFKKVAEDRYNTKFNRISDNFEYAVKNGNFPLKLKLTYNDNGLSAISYETSFVIKQGNKHEGYYTFGNGRYLDYYMPTKPNMIARFFMKQLLGFKWVDEKNDQ